jgi:hypothetical protein
MPAKPKPKSKHFSRKTLLIAAGVITAVVIAYVYWRKKQSATQPQAAYSDSVGNLPGQNYLPATGVGGASTLGQGIAAPPPAGISCPGGQQPNPDGTCPSPVTGPPTGNGGTPPPATTTYKHGCFSGAGPGCGGPNMHCEYWTVTDGSGQASPPPNCAPQGAGQQQAVTSPGQAGSNVNPPVTSDVLSAAPTAAPVTPTSASGAPLGFPKASEPTATSDPAVRFLSITQTAGRGGNPSNVYEASSPNFDVGPLPPVTFPPRPTPPPVNPPPPNPKPTSSGR